MLLETKQRDIAIQDLALKLRLENMITRELQPLLNRINRDFRTTYAASGRVLDFSRYEADIASILRRHYERTQRAFRGRVAEQNEKIFSVLEAKQEEERDLINLGLLNWINGQLEVQPAAINETTQRDARMAIDMARQDLTEREEEVSLANIAVAAAVINRRRLLGRLTGIATTETQSAAESTKQIEAEALTGRIPFTVAPDPFALTRPRDVELTAGEKQWITVADDRVRVSHMDADRQTVSIDTAFSVGGAQLRHPGDMSLGAPLREWINCLHPDSVVNFADANALTRRLYKGVMITIETSSGNKLTITPNHPILTVSGWKPAYLVKECDSVISANVAVWRGLCKRNIKDRNLSIEKIYNLLSVAMPSAVMRVGSAAVNFHGETGGNEDVDIILPNGELRYGIKSFFSDVIHKISFISADFAKGSLFSFGLINKPFFSCFFFTSCFIRSLGKIFSFVGRCLGHSQIHALTPVSRGNTSLLQSIDNHTSANIKFSRNGFNRHWLMEHIGNNTNLFFKDEVFKITHKQYFGFVYNLESEKSYYVSNGIVNHNCRCSSNISIEGF